MNSIYDIYHYKWRKYQRQFEQLIKSVNLPFDIEALYYYKINMLKQVVEIPIIFHPNFLKFAEYEKVDSSLFANFENLLQLPPIMDSDYIKNIEIKYQSYSHLESFVGGKLYKLPIMLRYQNNAISWIGVYVDIKNYYIAKQYEGGNCILTLHNLIESSYDRIIYTKDFEYINSCDVPKVNEINIERTIDQFKNLSRAENRCFVAIYNGKYESRDIAAYLSRSVRTVEGLMVTMIYKLNLKNRYELFVKVSEGHIHMRYLFSNGMLS